MAGSGVGPEVWKCTHICTDKGRKWLWKSGNLWSQKLLSMRLLMCENKRELLTVTLSNLNEPGLLTKINGMVQ